MRLKVLGAAMVVILMLVGGAGGAAAQTYAMPKTEPQFRVEWQEGKSKKGAPILEGYVERSSLFVLGAAQKPAFEPHL